MERKKGKHVLGKGGEVKQQKIKDESGGRVKKLTHDRFEAIRNMTNMQDAGLHIGKRNRGLRRQPLRRHK